MSTVLGSIKNDPVETERSSKEVEYALLRAQQRARAFVCQTAPHSPTKSSPNTSPPPASWQPNLARNKNNERVKSSLKLRPGLTRANSEPSHKSVHFSTTNLVDVRQFKRGQKPSAVSKQIPKFYYPDSESSADQLDNDDDDEDDDEDDDDDYDDDDYDDDYDDEESEFNGRGMRNTFLSGTNSNKKRQPASEGWTLLTPGFVPHAMCRLPGKERPTCYVDTLQLCASPLCFKAIVFVRNIAFRKYVALRYTLNDWETFTEIQGTYSSDIRKLDRDNGYDRFDVAVPLSRFDRYELNSSSLKFCVHFTVDGAEFWDNNNGKNYEVFMRNSKLARKRPATSSTNDSTTPFTASSGKSHRRRAESVPQLDISFSEDDFVTEVEDDVDVVDETEDTDDTGSRSGGGKYHHSRSGRGVSHGGIIFRKPDKQSERDSFINRYSFETAFSDPPVSPQDRTEKSLFGHNGVKPEVHIATNSATSTEPKSTNPIYKNEPQLTAAATAQSWESESYKDFVSKYCFYTPQGRNPSVKSPLSQLETSSAPTDPSRSKA